MGPCEVRSFCTLQSSLLRQLVGPTVLIDSMWWSATAQSVAGNRGLVQVLRAIVLSESKILSSGCHLCRRHGRVWPSSP